MDLLARLEAMDAPYRDALIAYVRAADVIRNRNATATVAEWSRALGAYDTARAELARGIGEGE